jgi:hypothetical protein
MLSSRGVTTCALPTQKLYFCTRSHKELLSASASQWPVERDVICSGMHGTVANGMRREVQTQTWLTTCIPARFSPQNLLKYEHYVCTQEISFLYRLRFHFEDDLSSRCRTSTAEGRQLLRLTQDFICCEMLSCAFWSVMTVLCKTRDSCVFGLRSSFCIVTREHNASGAGILSILRRGDLCLLGPLERANLSHWT